MLYSETDDSHLKSLIEKYLPYFEEVERFCDKMNVPNVTVDPEAIRRAILRALKMRDRYTILFYLNDRGLLEEYTDRAAKEFVKRVCSK